MRDPAFLFYTKDFQSGTQAMSCEELGSYMRLIMYQHQHDSIPYEPERMMRICGIFSEERFAEIWEVVGEKFDLMANHLVNQRLKQEMNVRLTGKPKKIAAATFAGLISRASLKKTEVLYLKKIFNIEDFIYADTELIKDEILIKTKVREWFNQMVDQMVNNLVNANADANADVFDINNNTSNMGGMGGEKSKPEKFKDFKSIVDLFNSTCRGLPTVLSITDARKISIRARVEDYPDRNPIELFTEIFKLVAESEFLNGTNERQWSAKFDWIVNKSNFVKILEGNYKNKEAKSVVKKIEPTAQPGSREYEFMKKQIENRNLAAK